MSGSQPVAAYLALPSEAEQRTFVNEAVERIEKFAFLMNREFDDNKPDKAFAHAITMLEDMKTNILSPIHYNELYQTVMGHMSHLSLNFQEPAFFPPKRVGELYETIQCIPALVPRLYLLFSLAPAFIKAGRGGACDVLKDLLELARGVQHPTKSLFLRYFLVHALKEVLPDGRHQQVGTIEDTLNFLLENFRQMNVLWVRLEFMLDVKSTDERKKQRSQLRQLVGSNIMRMAALRGLDVGSYKQIVIPFLVSQVHACHETLAQTYLIECITQSFPAEFHMETLTELFGLFTCVEDDVPTLQLATAIITRLQEHFESAGVGIDAAIATVKLVAEEIDRLLKAGQNFTLEDTIDMLTALLNCALSADSENAGNANAVMQFLDTYVSTSQGDKRLENPAASRKLRDFLASPLHAMKDGNIFYELAFFAGLVDRMMYPDRKMIAVEVCRAFARTDTLIDDVEKLRAFFGIIVSLLQRPDDYIEDQATDSLPVCLKALGHVMPLIRSERSYDLTYQLLSSVVQTVRGLKLVVKGGVYLSLAESLLRLAVDVGTNPGQSNVQVKHVLQLFYAMLLEGAPSVPAIYAYLDGALVSDLHGAVPITVEFYVQAIKHWKEASLPPALKYRMFVGMLKTATQLKNVTASAYNAITANLCECAATAVPKDNQIEAHLLTSHLFNVQNEAEVDEGEPNPFKNVEQVKACLVRALKEAATVTDVSTQLLWFYRILGHAVYFIEDRVPIPAEWFNALTLKIDQVHEANQKEIELNMPVETRMFYVCVLEHKNAVVNF
jgi:vacuolar protein sorting-associated protein 35